MQCRAYVDGNLKYFDVYLVFDRYKDLSTTGANHGKFVKDPTYTNCLNEVKILEQDDTLHILDV